MSEHSLCPVLPWSGGDGEGPKAMPGGRCFPADTPEKTLVILQTT